MKRSATVEKLRQAVSQSAASRQGVFPTSVCGLSVMRYEKPTGLMHEIYTSVVCLVLQGTKEVTIGDGAHAYKAGQHLIVGVDMPVVSEVTEASCQEPYLALSLDLDTSILLELSAQIPCPKCENPEAKSALFTDETNENLVECATRLIGLAERPEAEPILRPGISREIHYLLLTGRLSSELRHLARPEGQIQGIAKAIALLRSSYAQRMHSEALAAEAQMSTSSFYQHFKAVTSYSPLQFQKHLRLMEARRLMLREGATAKRAAFAVGYESAPQFTRDYAKRFGQPPRREVKSIRTLGTVENLTHSRSRQELEAML